MNEKFIILFSIATNILIVKKILKPLHSHANSNIKNPSNCIIKDMNFLNLNKIIKIKKDKNLISKYAITDFVDTLILNLQAGLPIFTSFERASHSISDKKLKEKCKFVLKKYYLGSSFFEATQAAIQPNLHDDLSEVFENISLSLKLGTSLTDNLTQVSCQLKAKTNSELEKLASEASVKMIFPLVFFIFPVIFILLGSASIEDFIKTLDS
ncbi:type II secretion system F family protein [Fluviispira multicolorata]|uniref:Type II secretion system protein GspF domain-containing protein n=1 Tax=Fluviispira multicolorata TaxID=2654512 RepID=A0A833JF26_9BACT|nr:type II secretion system F family protein [Fluviispira multicolorata]KAB8033213.1 hypothetical protein GCL57_00515 [Fluviispira multicolorata]